MTNPLKTVCVFLFFALALAGAANSALADSAILAPGAQPQKIDTGYGYTEGPASDAQGNVFFTDQPNDRILKWSVDGKITTFLQPCGHSNGLCFDAQGNLWACADEKNQLWEISPAGKVTVVVTQYGGKLLNGPNDVWVRPDGGLYLTDPFYARPYWKRGPMEQTNQNVFYLSPDHKTLTPVATDLQMPNGLIGTADGKTLYVSDISGGMTYAYNIERDGMLTGKRLFCKMGSDGMTIDSAGNLYLTGHGVSVFNPDGQQIMLIPITDGYTGNVCFGGKDKHTLFITASASIYTLQMSVQGVGSQ